MRKRRIHDAIVGTVITIGVALGFWVSPTWLLLPGVVGLLMIQSGFTGFCPVYFTLDQLGVGDGTPVEYRPRQQGDQEYLPHTCGTTTRPYCLRLIRLGPLVPEQAQSSLPCAPPRQARNFHAPSALTSTSV